VDASAQSDRFMMLGERSVDHGGNEGEPRKSFDEGNEAKKLDESVHLGGKRGCFLSAELEKGLNRSFEFGKRPACRNVLAR